MNALKWLLVAGMSLAMGAAQADPIQDNTLNGYKAGWYPNFEDKKPMTCPQTCKVKVNGMAEQEKTVGTKSSVTHVCKFGSRDLQIKPIRDARFLYGNQFDKTPSCLVADANGKVAKSDRFYCLCIAGEPAPCKGPDLVVTKIEKPQWDNANHRSIIKAEIKNIGSAAAGASIARVIDPSTTQPTGAPYNAIANTPALAAGASVTVTFELPYWVYNPDAELEVTADYKGIVEECNETNNSLIFHEQG